MNKVKYIIPVFAIVAALAATTTTATNVQAQLWDSGYGGAYVHHGYAFQGPFGGIHYGGYGAFAGGAGPSGGFGGDCWGGCALDYYQHAWWNGYQVGWNDGYQAGSACGCGIGPSPTPYNNNQEQRSAINIWGNGNYANINNEAYGGGGGP